MTKVTTPHLRPGNIKISLLHIKRPLRERGKTDNNIAPSKDINITGDTHPIMLPNTCFFPGAKQGLRQKRGSNRTTQRADLRHSRNPKETAKQKKSVRKRSVCLALRVVDNWNPFVGVDQSSLAHPRTDVLMNWVETSPGFLLRARQRFKKREEELERNDRVLFVDRG